MENSQSSKTAFERIGDWRRTCFVLTQLIKIARKEGRDFICCSLDVAKACDSVPHRSLLQCLRRLDMHEEQTDLLQKLYNGGIVTAKFGGVVSTIVKVESNLKQCCPLSLLYMLCTAELEQLPTSGLGFIL